MEIDAVQQLNLLMRVGLGLALGAVIGIERELQREEAGLRTHSLVGLGAALFTIVSGYAFAGLEGGDPTRIAAQVVTGIGFIGAGTIIRNGGAVRGLSTAASLWAVGAIGMACGAGLYILAVGGTALAIFVLEVLDRLEQRLIRHRVAADASAIEAAGPPS